jgi:hypothetical protein
MSLGGTKRLMLYRFPLDKGTSFYVTCGIDSGSLKNTLLEMNPQLAENSYIKGKICDRLTTKDTAGRLSITSSFLIFYLLFSQFMGYFFSWLENSMVSSFIISTIKILCNK